MRNNRRFWLLVALSVLLPGWMAAQAPARTSPQNPSAVSDEDREATRERLFKLLRLSPRLTVVLSRDPSLLNDQEYVSRNNPELAQFLQQHPEVPRNPEFYLFADSGHPGMRLEQYVFPDTSRTNPEVWYILRSELMPSFFVVVFLIAILWLLRVILENRRWSKVLSLQSDVHGKLLDKFANNQELLAYMNTEAGKRFLEAAPLPSGPELATTTKMSLARILLPLQVGVVLVLLGGGLFLLRDNPELDAHALLLALGTVGITLGIGFIISAGLAFVLARHFDLLPKKADKHLAKEQL